MKNTLLIEKIDKEAEKGGAYEKLIAQHIIDRLSPESETAEAEKKSLKECLKTIMDKAKKQARNSVAVIEDDAVYTLAREYFGIKEEVKATAGKADSLDVDLFDLI